jgi:hypothetical protein
MVSKLIFCRLSSESEIYESYSLWIKAGWLIMKFIAC